MDYIYKIFVFIFILAILRILREIFYFVLCFKNNTKYTITPKRRLWLWCSISYILTIIFNGFN